MVPSDNPSSEQNGHNGGNRPPGSESNGQGNGEHNGNGNGYSNGQSSSAPLPRVQPMQVQRDQQVLDLTRQRMAESEERSRLSFLDYLSLIWRGKWVILACLLIAGVGSAFYTYSLPFVYESSLQITVNEHDESIEPLLGGSSGWQTPGRVLQKEMQVFTSRPILEKSAQAILARRFLDVTRKDSVIPMVQTAEVELSKRKYLTTPDEKYRFLFDRVSRAIKKAIVVKTAKDADIIQVTMQTGDPYEAALILNTYAQVYQLDNQLQNRSKAKSVKEFVEEKLRTTGDSLGRQEVELKDYQVEHKILGPEIQTGDLLSSKTKLDQDANAAQIQISTISRRLDEYKHQLAAVDTTFSQEVASATAQYIPQMLSQIAGLEVERQLIIATNPPRASEVWYQGMLKSYDIRIAELKKRLDVEVLKVKNSRLGAIQSSESSGPTGALNSLRQKVFEDGINLQALKAQLAAIDQARGEIDQRLANIPEQNLGIERIKREKEGLEKIYLQLNDEYNKKVLEEQSVFSNVRVIDPAQPDRKPISPNRIANIVVGSVVGFAIGIGIVLLIAFTDTTVHSPDDLQKNGFTVLTAIPLIPEELLIQTGEDGEEARKLSPHMISHIAARSPIAESYRSLRTAVSYASIERKIRVILVTSSVPQEGKSTTSSNLSIVLAQSGARTLLVDCDLRRPILHSIFGLHKEPGLVNCLVGTSSIDEAVVASGIPDLWLLRSGSIPPNPSELLGSHRMVELLEELKERFDTIILDSPPVGAVTDGVILSTIVDATIVVVRAHQTKLEFLQRTHEELERVFVPPLGVVLNDFNAAQSYGYGGYKYYHYYKYYSYYGQGEDKHGRKRRSSKESKEETEDVTTS